MDQLLAIFVFALSTAFTPGPNNTMLMMSGANFGVMRSLPHMLGIAIGFPLMVFAVGMGLGGLFERAPLLHDVLRYGAFAWLVFLAWKLARSGRVEADGTREGRPMGFLAAALFQWVNPKAWMMAVGALALYGSVGGTPLAAATILALAFALMAAPSSLVWCLFGTAIARFLDDDRRVAFFNGAMAVLLVASMVPTLL